jgi:hypothetical protein
MTARASRPDATEFAPYYSKYIDLLPGGDILEVLAEQTEELTGFLRRVPEKEAGKRHPPYTWSVKEVVGHITDAERIFGYRALRIARQDETPLSGFDENAYVKNAGFDTYRLSDLAAEFEFLRRSHLCFFRGLASAAWQCRGVANGNPVSVRAIACIIAGHARHHELILRKRLGA